MNGDVTAYGVMTIGGALYIPSNATVDSALVSSKGVILGPVTVPDPCDCAANQLIDVASIVSAGQATNDDSVIGLDPNVFVNGAGALRLDLPCGRYYLTAITFNGTATIAVHGHAALFVGGDIDSNGGLEITLDPQATLDLFIGGNLTLNGDPLRRLDAGPQPDAHLRRREPGQLQRRRSAGRELLPPLRAARAQRQPRRLRLDLRRRLPGQRPHLGPLRQRDPHRRPECGDAGAPPGGCASCRDCDNQACIGGVCGPCTTSAQCCAPLICNAGTCGQAFE